MIYTFNRDINESVRAAQQIKPRYGEVRWRDWQRYSAEFGQAINLK
jgi:hypothetical protein